ncbi:hypothetical protein C8Q70DRAFT_654786 [Cubamyces menziesii]|nr:hypothetical protein C8Q70DRAFT_654786 [Cubamyces menziesii]
MAASASEVFLRGASGPGACCLSPQVATLRERLYSLPSACRSEEESKPSSRFGRADQRLRHAAQTTDCILQSVRIGCWGRRMTRSRNSPCEHSAVLPPLCHRQLKPTAYSRHRMPMHPTSSTGP